MSHGERDRAREQNRQAWNRLVEKKNRFTRPAKDEDLVDPLGTVDAIGWLGGDIRGLKLLCLAAGGGKHGAIYAQAGALVTVVDLSPAMLELDRQVAAERGRVAQAAGAAARVRAAAARRRRGSSVHADGAHRLQHPSNNWNIK